MPDPKAPTTEIGRPGPVGVGGFPTVPDWSQFIDDREYAADARWPASVQLYERMQTDAQIKGLLMATTLPIRRFRWEIDPNGAKPEVVDHVAASLNLPVRGQDPKPTRRRKRFSWDKHLSHALQSLVFGHYYFEQVYEVREPRPGGVHLKKLGTRPPRTIANILTDEQGGLAGIVQNVGFTSAGLSGAPLVGEPITVNRLLGYLWDTADDGDWVGRSMLRACFRDWLVKDKLIRVNATKHERNAVGIPWFEVDANAGKEQIDALAAIAEQMRAGVRQGGAGPGKLSIKGVEGTLPDTIGDVRYHDEQMAKAFILLFFSLGTTETGSRALGSEFIDWYTQGQSTIADAIRDQTQEHQIEDEVEINWGPDEQPPLLAYTRIENAEASIEDLKQMKEVGLIAVDEEVSSWIVQRYGLPSGAIRNPEDDPTPPTPPPVPPPTPPADPEAEPAEEGEPAAAAATKRRKRSALAQRIEAAASAPMPWPALARAASSDPKNGTARRARDELVTAGVLVKLPGGKLAPSAAVKLPDRELRRQPYAFEVAASVDFAAMESTYVEDRASLVALVKAAQGDQIDELAAAVEAAAGDAVKLAKLSCEPVDAEAIAERMLETAQAGQASAEAEHAAQTAGATASVPRAAADELVEATILERARAVALTLASGFSVAASKRAAAVSTLEPSAAASDVREFLGGLSDAELERQLGGATSSAYNTGRFNYMATAKPTTLYASELLDANTCPECTAIDGTEYDTIEEAEADYPVGGYLNCEGGLLCRGTAVGVYE